MFRVASSSSSGLPTLNEHYTMKLAETHRAQAEDARGPEEIDLSLLEDSLRLTPWQRLLENERALALVRMLEAAHLPHNGTTDSTHRAS